MTVMKASINNWDENRVCELPPCMSAQSIQSCLTLCDPTDCCPPGSSVHGMDSPGKNTEVGCHFLLQNYLLNNQQLVIFSPRTFMILVL